MGLFDALKGLKKEEITRIPAPGSTTAELPAGQVSIRWEEDRESLNQKAAYLRLPDDLVVTIARPSGEPLEVHRATGGSSGASRGRIFRPFGHVDVELADTYEIKVETASSHPNPAVVLRA